MSGTVLPGVRELFPGKHSVIRRECSSHLWSDLFPKSTTTAKQGQQLDSVTAQQVISFNFPIVDCLMCRQQTGVVTSSVVPAYSSPGDYGSAENAVESSTVTSFCSLLFRQADGNVYAVPALRPAAWSHQSRAAGSYGVINDRKKYACAHCTKRFERYSLAFRVSRGRYLRTLYAGRVPWPTT